MTDTNGGVDVDTIISSAGGTLLVARSKEEVKKESGICDKDFLEELKSLKHLHSFIIKEAVGVAYSGADLHVFGNLSSLYSEPKGRRATPEEWASVERLTQELFGHLTDPLRQKYTASSIPRWISILSLCLAGAALLSLLFSIIFGTLTNSIFFGILGKSTEELNYVSQTILLFYALWLFSLGSLGAIAFIGMNALSIQQDITFDLANSRLMILRIVLGGLFAFVLTLPFGFDSYVTFCYNVALAKIPLFDGGAQLPLAALMLILPFILGFSAPLVIMILNQFIEAVQAFCGKRSSPPLVPGALSRQIEVGSGLGAP